MDKGKGALAVITVPAVVVSSMFAFILLIASAGPAAAACTAPGATVDLASIPTTAIGGYSGTQLQNAGTIMNAADALGLDVQAQLIGVMTAMGESGLQNLDHGDTAGPDSLGLFRQRANWGTAAQRMDPTQSATLFFQKLTTVPNWESLDPSIAAHDVQGNADPNFYTPYFAKAQTVVAKLGGVNTTCIAAKQAGNDYPWQSSPVDTLSPLGYDYRECVDFVAYRLNRDAGVTSGPWKYTWANLTPLGGDALDWKENWEAHDWEVSHTPVVGSVAWWGAGSAGTLGHVAYVQAVNANGTVELEEYNWDDNHTYSTRTIAATAVDDFLYPPPRT
jgi:surface antigen